ncbi:MAG: hypothetical protein ACR2QM_02260 [Longimicrobiales bacterium]
MLLTTALVAGPAQAQTFGDVNPRALSNGPLLLEIPNSTRALALGNAYAGSDSDAIFYHPALLSGSGAGADFQHFGSGGTHLSLSAGTEWFGGQIGFGVSALDYGAAGESTDALLRDLGSLGVEGPVGASEYALSVGYKMEVAGPIEAGVVAKVVGQRLGGLSGSTAAVDLGVSMDTGPVTLALSAQNLGPEIEVGDTSPPLALAKRVTLGAASDRRPVGPFDIGAAAQITRDGAGDLLPGGGIEVAWWPVVGRTFIARVGARRIVEGVGSAVTFGGGFTGDRIRLDYAFQGFDAIDGAHRFGVAFR